MFSNFHLLWFQLHCNQYVVAFLLKLVCVLVITQFHTLMDLVANFSFLKSYVNNEIRIHSF